MDPPRNLIATAGDLQSQMSPDEWRRLIKDYRFQAKPTQQEWAHLLPGVDRSLLAAVTDDDHCNTGLRTAQAGARDSSDAALHPAKLRRRIFQ